MQENLSNVSTSFPDYLRHEIAAKKPHVSAQETWEWWCGGRSVTVTVCACCPGRVGYLKVWGTNIETDMEIGTLHGAKDFHPLWQWLESTDDTEIK
ncbi:MAG: hypothetical protein H7Y38_05890 [Armatimonadetes bacterium]|nr:hypothetical protein [Armatimonadota bacterium]